MRTLNTPLYEVKQNSELYKNGKRRLDSIEEFFSNFKEKYGTAEGFTFHTSRDFGVYIDTPCYKIFKDSVEEGDKPGYYSFREDSEHYQEISPMIRETVDYDGFVLSATFGLFNIASSQWIKDRLFFQVKNDDFYRDGMHYTKDIEPVNYDDYLKLFKEEK